MKILIQRKFLKIRTKNNVCKKPRLDAVRQWSLNMDSKCTMECDQFQARGLKMHITSISHMLLLYPKVPSTWATQNQKRSKGVAGGTITTSIRPPRSKWRGKTILILSCINPFCKTSRRTTSNSALQSPSRTFQTITNRPMVRHLVTKKAQLSSQTQTIANCNKMSLFSGCQTRNSAH